MFIQTYTTSDTQAIACHRITDPQLPTQAAENNELPLLSKLLPYDVTWDMCMGYPFGQLKTAKLILLPSSNVGPLLSMALALYNFA